GEFGCASGPAQVAREMLVFTEHLLNGRADMVGRILLAQMSQHQNTGAQHRGRVGNVFAGDVGSRAVYRFENGALVAKVRTRYHSQATHEGGAQVGDNDTVEFLQ